MTLDIILSETNNKNISNLTTLNITGKNITDISILSKFPTLENISLINNHIKDLNVFKNLKNLKKLNLKDNKVNEFGQIESLKNCKQLESLCLKENPISKEPNYLQKIKELLPQLKKIDDIEINKNNKDIKLSFKMDNKKIDKLNMITSKFIKFKTSKNKGTNTFSGSPIRQKKNNVNNNDINKMASSGKKNQKENNNLNNSNKKNQNDGKTENNNDKNEEENFENININDEKKKIENEAEKNKSNTKKELLCYSFKKKRTIGKFYILNKKNIDNNIDANATLDNIKIDNNLINTFNDENKNLNYSLSNSKYSRKIIGKFPGTHNLLSQSIRYDDENEDDNNNDIRLSQKNKLGSIKNRLFNKLTNQINNNNDNKNNVNENEKLIIKSIKLLLSNLGESELNQINKDLINTISKLNK